MNELVLLPLELEGAKYTRMEYLVTSYSSVILIFKVLQQLHNFHIPTMTKTALLAISHEQYSCHVPNNPDLFFFGVSLVLPLNCGLG